MVPTTPATASPVCSPTRMASLFAIYSFTAATPQEGGDGISVATAKALHDAYLATNRAPIDAAIQAIELSSTAIAAAQDILSQNGDADGVAFIMD